MPHIRFDVPVRPIPPCLLVDKRPAQVLPFRAKIALRRTIIASPDGIDRDEPRFYVRAGRAGDIEVRWDFKPDGNSCILEPSCANRVLKSNSAGTEVLRQVAELLQSLVE